MPQDPEAGPGSGRLACRRQGVCPLPDPAHHPGQQVVREPGEVTGLGFPASCRRGMGLGSSGLRRCGHAEGSRTMAAMVWCPSGEKCRRSGSHIRGIPELPQGPQISDHAIDAGRRWPGCSR